MASPAEAAKPQAVLLWRHGATIALAVHSGWRIRALWGNGALPNPGPQNRVGLVHVAFGRSACHGSPGLPQLNRGEALPEYGTGGESLRPGRFHRIGLARMYCTYGMRLHSGLCLSSGKVIRLAGPGGPDLGDLNETQFRVCPPVPR